MQDRHRLLFIDDSRSQLQLYREQLGGDSYDVATASTYEAAMASLGARSPDLIVLDMVMPQVNGLEFLDILKSAPSFRHIPVIMVSAEKEPAIVRQAFLKGAADFVRKPYDTEELQLRIGRLLTHPAGIQGAKAKPQLSAQSLTIKALADLAATRDNETGFHLRRVERYTVVLALALAKKREFQARMDESFLETVGEVSVLHDIGKVGIPDAILKKPGRLTPEEFEIMKTHTTIGAETIRKVQEEFTEFSFLELARLIALHHHEKWDGTGYPGGLSGDRIPLAAQLVALVDVFDALTTQRIYKAAMSIDEALGIMNQDRGRQFNPVLFDVFLGCLPEFRKIHAELGEVGEQKKEQ